MAHDRLDCRRLYRLCFRSFPFAVGQRKGRGGEFRWDFKQLGRQTKVFLQRGIAVISLVFLLAYASAQLVAGSKALQGLLEWPTWRGSLLGAGLVVFYCFSGGIRASIWTDAAQAIVMMLAMGLMLVMAVISLGGAENAVNQMSEIEGFLNWFPVGLVFPGFIGGVFFAVSWLFSGLSVLGQPHVMIRFMTLESTAKMNQARFWYYSCYTLFCATAIGVGMLSRIYLGTQQNFDSELALPAMAEGLLPPVLVGLVLAGIFAASISTADSLILSCSSAVTHDLFNHRLENTKLIKMGTVAITMVALVWALVNKQSVFNLVVVAWSGLASAFAPLLIFLCLGQRPGHNLSIIAIMTGLSVALFWRYLGWQSAVYEGMPGILAGLITLYLFHKPFRFFGHLRG